jgi:homoprotocatechuate degradation regulator HpaR
MTNETTDRKTGLLPYRHSLAGTLLGAREAVMEPIRPLLRDAGVTEQQWRVLRVVNDEGSINASSLADAAMLHGPSVTRILRELKDRGLIERRADPEDARRSIIRITIEGEELVRVTAQQTRAILDQYATVFGRERVAALRAELIAFSRAIRAVGHRVPAD